MPRVPSLLIAVATIARTLTAQQDPMRAIRAYQQTHQAEIVRDLTELVAIPNVASDSVNIRRNARQLVALLGARGVHTELWETGGPPIVYGEIGDAALPTVLFYCHYDGQPANPSSWAQHDPWTPVLLSGSREAGGRPVTTPPADGQYPGEWRLYGRSASDDKAPIVALLHMLDAWRSAGVPLRNRLIFLLEGDEEAGSHYLAQVARAHHDRLQADLAVMADGPIHPSGRPTADFGLRGITTVTLTLYGAVRPLHSGHYGNWAPNPAMRLAQLLATMKGPDGEVLVQGWEDDMVPLGPAERAALDRYPHDDEARRKELELGSLDGHGRPRMELIAHPSLNVRGLRSLFTGPQARTLIPDVAVAELDLRLVAGNDPERQVHKLVRHIERQGYTVVRAEPDSAMRVRTPRLVRITVGQGYPAGRTPLDTPAARALVAALAGAGLGEPVVSPTMGGSGPAYVFTEILGVPFAVVPTVNHDNNQHAANENIRLANLYRGMVILGAAATASLPRP